MSITDGQAMAHALALGRRGLGQTWPNPSVACVLVKDGRVVGRGRTGAGGRPHAEPQALAQAGDLARGATAYVTLEPCAHHGQTPPCTEALIAAGVARVVAPVADSDPRVDGAGFARLRAAGIDVTTGIMADEALRDHAGFFLRVTEGRPFVTLKLAQTLDGRIATATGESQWITGPEARRQVHLMRSRHDLVLVGAGTARADDPTLTVRGLGPMAQPVRAVVSRKLDVDPGGNLSRAEGPLWMIHGPDAPPERQEAWSQAGARLIPTQLAGRQVDMASALQSLGAAGITRVFCEGGGELAASLLSGGLVDELVVFSAGIALGAEGRPGLGAMGVAALAEAPRLRLAEQRRIGADVMQVWRR